MTILILLTCHLSSQSKHSCFADRTSTWGFRLTPAGLNAYFWDHSSQYRPEEPQACFKESYQKYDPRSVSVLCLNRFPHSDFQNPAFGSVFVFKIPQWKTVGTLVSVQYELKCWLSIYIHEEHWGTCYFEERKYRDRINRSMKTTKT